MKIRWRIYAILIMAASICFSSKPALAALNIALAFTGTGLSNSQKAAFESAEAFWENALLGYQPGILIAGPTIFASGSFIDGVGGTIGQAAPTATANQAGYEVTLSAMMSFDSDDLVFLESRSLLVDVLKHEMAHALGYGYFWNQNGLYVSGSGKYTGANGLAQYQNEFVGQSSATFVPVELGGGGGTADFHWDEVDQGAGLTGRVTTYGRDMRDELMTGWLNTQLPSFVSRTTLGQFEDIGFVANYASVPEPSSSALGLLGVLRLLFTRWRSRKNIGITY
ncbi:MAG: peptidase [Pirellulaceae bacterium]|nr:peptidase [Pirellulaceae bacterium]